MRAIFREHGMHAQPVPPVSSPTDWVYRLRSSTGYRRTFHFVSYHLFPNLFGIAMLVLLAGVLPLRTIFELRSRAGLLQASTCGQADPAGLIREAGTFALWPHLLCNATGMTVEKGQRYRVEIALPEACAARRGDGPGHDAAHGRLVRLEDPGHEHAGLLLAGRAGWIGHPEDPHDAGRPAAPRGHAPTGWCPVAEIGTTNPLRVPLVEDTFVAGQDGPLSLWVNDLILPCPGVGLLLSQQRRRSGHRADHESGVARTAAAAREAYVSVTLNA